MTSDSFTTTCSLHAASLEAWVTAVNIHGACCLLGAVPVALVVWYCRGNRRWRRGVSLVLGTAIAAIVLCGTLVLRSSSTVLWMGPFLASTMAFGTFFKCCNCAGIGDVPDGAEASLTNWLLWFLLVPEPIFLKGKLQVASRSIIQARLWAMVGKMWGLSAVVSVLVTAPRLQPEFPTFTSALFLGFLHTWTIYMFASLCLDISALTAFLLGPLLVGHPVRLHDGFRHPLWHSRTFREAWGARWNDAVQRLLQRTVYVPLRRTWSRPAAVVATFAASGLLHEYNFLVHNTTAYRPGIPLLFFTCMGCIVVAEGSSKAWLERQTRWLPTPLLATLLTLVVAVPVKLYFMRSWFDAGFLDTLTELFPTIRCA